MQEDRRIHSAMREGGEGESGLEKLTGSDMAEDMDRMPGLLNRSPVCAEPWKNPLAIIP
jgi:hypothetical protein